MSSLNYFHQVLADKLQIPLHYLKYEAKRPALIYLCVLTGPAPGLLQSLK
jgi:hypothetical protein